MLERREERDGWWVVEWTQGGDVTSPVGLRVFRPAESKGRGPPEDTPESCLEVPVTDKSRSTPIGTGVVLYGTRTSVKTPSAKVEIHQKATCPFTEF